MSQLRTLPFAAGFGAARGTFISGAAALPVGDAAAATGVMPAAAEPLVAGAVVAAVPAVPLVAGAAVTAAVALLAVGIAGTGDCPLVPPARVPDGTGDCPPVPPAIAGAAVRVPPALAGVFVATVSPPQAASTAAVAAPAASFKRPRRPIISCISSLLATRYVPERLHPHAVSPSLPQVRHRRARYRTARLAASVRSCSGWEPS